MPASYDRVTFLELCRCGGCIESLAYAAWTPVHRMYSITTAGYMYHTSYMYSVTVVRIRYEDA